VANNSDYTKNNTDFYELLPDVYKNDVSRAVFNNLFNRYVTKPELIHRDGYAGVGNPNALIKRQLEEPTPARQAYQLQPILHNKIGTIDHQMSYEDILAELRHMGIDTDKLPEWFTPQKFNWVPPIDIDKALNYRDYYWYDPENPTSSPQYFTIKNICNVVDGRVTIYQKTLDAYGESFPIKGLDATENVIEVFGDYAALFVADFIFFTKTTSNPDLVNRNWVVESSTYDPETDKTSIKTVQNFNNDTIVNGVVSISEFLDVLLGERDCVCSGAFGFDNALFDDNQIGEILWNTDLLAAVSHPTFTDWLNAGNNPALYDLWYDTTTNTLKQYDETLGVFTDESNWIVVQNEFSILVDKTEGTHFWDFSLGCEYPRNQWVDQNRWLHKSLIPNFGIAKQATIPILEFEPFLELNDWACTTHEWEYRSHRFNEFEAIDAEPDLLELSEVNTYDINGQELVAHAKYGDLTPSLPVGYQFTILDSVGALFDVINITTGFGGAFIVSGDATPYYTDINDIVNPFNLPHIFKVRNSPTGTIDHEWTIDAISYDSFSDRTTLTLIPTEFINVFSFLGAQVYTSNTATYTVNHSLFKTVRTVYDVVDYFPLAFQMSVTGAMPSNLSSFLSTNFNFTDFFFTDVGVFTYTILSYDAITDTTLLQIKEQLPSALPLTEIYVENFRTVITVDETFNSFISAYDGQELAGISDGSRIVPSKTSQGDEWRAYHEHWLYIDVKSVEPINHQTINPNAALEGLPIQLNTSDYADGLTYTNGEFEYSVGISSQRFKIVNALGMVRFDFHEALLNQVRKDNNLVRVYVQTLDDNKRLRQYGNYDELTNGNDFVSGIEFTALNVLPTFAEVFIEIGSSVLSDVSLENATVRTERDEDTFQNDPAAGVELLDLSRIRIQEQIKTDVNQYPLFDIYDIYGNTLKRVSKIFSYVESPDEPINFAVNLRIVQDGSDFLFEQGLVNETTGEMYTYRNFTQGHRNYYVNSIDLNVQYWDNFTWNERILTDTHYLTTISSNLEPFESWNRIEGQIWYRPISNELFVMDDSDVFISVLFDFTTIDRTLKTIWQPGLNNEKYEPKYVNGERVEVPITSADGDWELADPLYYNVHHENHHQVKMSELIAHFRTIIDSQDAPTGFSGSEGEVFHLNLNPNFGLGGTIRNYNDSIDTLFSSVFLNSVTIDRVIDFAHDQYKNSLISLTELYIKNAVDLLADLTVDGIIYQKDFIVDFVINTYENNDISDILYSDSPTYDGVEGVKNWIATLPFFGFGKAFQPLKIEDAELGIKQLLHHDGHYSNPDISDATRESIIKRLMVVPDIRIGAGEFLGNHKSLFTSLPPANITDYRTAFDAVDIFSGKYWYTTLNGTRTLYRMLLVKVDNDAPDTNYPEGSFYYDPQFDTLYTLLSGAWTVATANGDGIVESAWTVIDVEEYGFDILLDVEQRLYDVLEPPIDIVVDYDGIKNGDITAYNIYESEEFSKYATVNQIPLPFTQLGVFNNIEPLTWNYYNSIIPDPAYAGAPIGVNVGGAWQDLYTKIYNTAYPHLEPWRLQGYHSQPEWWDTEYKETDGSRRWIYDHATTVGMWENIKNGLVPLGYNLPNGELSLGVVGAVKQYSFFSIMIDDNAVDGYNSDDLLPPFWNHIPFSLTPDVRSLFYDFGTQIVQPQLDYEFGTAGTVEWEWRTSSKYGYDRLFSTFRIQPTIVMKDTFGIQYNIVNDLQVNRDTAKVYSHKDALFHGDLMLDNNIFQILGTNQWYTNFNRFSGYDTSASDFRSMWVNWEVPLTYQFASFIDDETFNVFNKNYTMVDEDYEISMKRTLGIEEYWVDSFQVSLLKIPTAKIAYDTDYEWVFELTSRSGNAVDYYDVKNYHFAIDENTGVGTFNKFKIINYDLNENCITIEGDLAYSFVEPFTIVDSTDNNGAFTPTSAMYDVILDVTLIKLLEPLNAITVEDGFANNQFRSIDWATGQEIRLESTELLPRPFVQDTPYYFIKISSEDFAIAENYQNALDGIFLNVQFPGTGRLMIGELTRTFEAISGINDSTIWKRYAVDRGFRRTLNSFSRVQGIQPVVDIITGYEDITEEAGWVFNRDSVEIDQTLGRVVNWQLELEEFINDLSTIQTVKLSAIDTYEIEADIVEDKFTFLEFNPSWGTGTRVVVSAIGDLPDPLRNTTSYYLIRDINDPVVCQLALTTSAAFAGNAVDITTVGDTVIIQKYIERAALEKFELNPFRNNVWFEPEIGIVSHVINGAFPDFKTEQTVFDQYGRTLYMDNINIFREDKVTKISVINGIINDVEPQPLFEIDEKKFIHIGGMHIFVDGYEHTIRFNNYTTEGFLVYDPFVGLNTTKFELLFDRQPIFNLRPNIGGKIILDKSDFVSNIETLTLDLQNAFNTYSTSESSDMTKLARKTIGYGSESTNFFDNINITEKSKFIFWRGMIQAKGSVNAIKAFVNSRQFIDANLDEFWAYKIAEYGDIKRKIYPEIKLVIRDTLSNEMKFEFIEQEGIPETNFKPITITDELTWFEYPNQQTELNGLGNQFYFNTETTSKEENVKTVLNGITTFENLTWLKDDGTDYDPILDVAYTGEAYYLTDVFQDKVIIQWDDGGGDLVEMVEGFGNDFVRINARIIRIFQNPSTLLDVDVKLFSLNMAKTKHNPLKIIDYKSDVTIENIPLWNPAKGHQYHLAQHLIDLTRPIDPAEYNVASVLSHTDGNPNTIAVLDPITQDVLDAWSHEHVDTVWLDDDLLVYYPYYDETVVPSVIDRMEKWGKLADYAEIKAYQWTESDLSPEEWNDIAAVEAVDKTIPNSIRKSGKVRELVYNTTTLSYEKNVVLFEKYNEFSTESYWLYDDVPFTSSNQEDINTYIEEVLTPKYNIKAYRNGEIFGIVNIFTLSVDTVADTSVIRIELDLTAQYGVVNPEDLITVIHFKYDVIDDEGIRIYPTIEEIDNGDYIVEVPNTQIITTDVNGDDIITYYFWVRDKTTIIDDKLSLFEIENQLLIIPGAYGIIQNLLPEDNSNFVPLPNRYNQIIIKGLAGIIDDNERYKLRFTHDFTLRDNLDDGETNLSLKNTHQEWKMFREKQPFHIDRWLWDRVTESILGNTIGGNLRIPSLDKELYDIKNTTDTRYGLDSGQIFIDKALAIDAITTDMFSPDNDFYPVDIDSFINSHSWDTQADILKMMDDIYNNFASEHVNRIYFSLLHIAFSLKLRYPDMIKTSMVSLHGIRILDSSVFDD